MSFGYLELFDGNRTVLDASTRMSPVPPGDGRRVDMVQADFEVMTVQPFETDNDAGGWSMQRRVVLRTAHDKLLIVSDDVFAFRDFAPRAGQHIAMDIACWRDWLGRSWMYVTALTDRYRFEDVDLNDRAALERFIPPGFVPRKIINNQYDVSAGDD